MCDKCLIWWLFVALAWCIEYIRFKVRFGKSFLFLTPWMWGPALFSPYCWVFLYDHSMSCLQSKDDGDGVRISTVMEMSSFQSWVANGGWASNIRVALRWEVTVRHNKKTKWQCIGLSSCHLFTGAAYLCVIRGWYSRPIEDCSISGFGLTSILDLKEKCLSIGFVDFSKAVGLVGFLDKISNISFWRKILLLGDSWCLR